MLAAIGTILLGALGWFAASFFGKPLLAFFELRRNVHEEMVFTGNITALELQNDRRAQFEKAYSNLRRLGAKVQAMHVSAPFPLRLYLARRGYDLNKAGRALIGLANSLHRQGSLREVQAAWIQDGLKLPRDWTAEEIKDMRAIEQRQELRL